jgi:hypothetical protein
MSQDYVQAFAVLHEDTVRRVEQAARDLEELERQLDGGIEDRSARTFIVALKLMTESIRSVLKELDDRFRAATSDWGWSAGGPPGTNAAESAYNSVNNLARFMNHRLEVELQLLRLPRSEELDVVGIPLARMAKRLVPNAEVLFMPSLSKAGYRVDNYDTARVAKIDQTLADNLARAFGDDIKFLRFMHPASRRTDVFEHAVFAHEVAHAVITRPCAPGEDQDEDEGEEPLRPTFQTIATDAASAAHPIDDDRLAVLQRWFEELACDTVAFRLIGPAFLVAFCEVTALNRPIHGGAKLKDHPPASVRFEHFTEELAPFEVLRVSALAEAALKAYLESHKGTEPDAPPVEEQERAWLRAAVAAFRNSLDAMLGDLQLNPQQLIVDAPRVFALAERGVPPAERIFAGERNPPADGTWSEEFDWRSIINGVLLWHLDKHGPPNLGSGADRVDHRRRSVELAAAAIELSEFQRQARGLREQYGDMFVDSEPLG